MIQICLSQIPRSKLRGIKFAAQQSCGVFDPRGSRQMDMQACPPGSLPAEIKNAAIRMRTGFFLSDPYNFSVGYGYKTNFPCRNRNSPSKKTDLFAIFAVVTVTGELYHTRTV